MHLTSVLVAGSLVGVAQAHVAMWNKGMYGYNWPNQAGDKTQNYNSNSPVTPLREADSLSLDQWFGHGYRSFPPLDGDFMELPSGGTFMGELACNRADSKMRDPQRTDAQIEHACGGEGALHTVNKFNGTVENKWFGGTSIGIAYTSDVNSLQPNDLTIISVNQASPWFRETPYQIPAGLPPCPAGGCICSWNWLHRANNGEGYPFEMYNLLYRCKVTGNTNPSNVVQRGAVAKDCTGAPGSCVKGPKTGLYLYQRSGNNLPHLDIPPTYTDDWGFSDGAQNDIFSPAATPAATTGIVNPFATPTGTGTAAVPDPTPTATSLPAKWKSIGCTVDQPSPRFLSTNIYSSDDNTISKCVGQCDSMGYMSASVQYGKECWCGNTTATPVMATDKECDVRCAGDSWAFCGGSYKANLFQKEVSAATTAVTTVATGTMANATTIATAATTAVNGTTAAPNTATARNTTTVAAPTTVNATTVATTSPTTTIVTTSPTTTAATTSPTTTVRTTTAATSTTSSTTTAPSPSSTVPAGWTALGCHAEGNGFRALNGTHFDSYQMTAAACIAFCSQQGFNYAGTQYANQCYCGNTFVPRNATGCDTKCGGDANQICGGAWRNSVYVNNAVLAAPSSSSSSSSSTTASSTTTAAATTTTRASVTTTSSTTPAVAPTTTTTSSTTLAVTTTTTNSPANAATTAPTTTATGTTTRSTDVTVTVTATVTVTQTQTSCPTTTTTTTTTTPAMNRRRRRLH